MMAKESAEKRISAREAAFLSLVRWEKEDKFINLEVDAAIKKYRFAGHDRGFYTALVYGVVERMITLDYVIGLFSLQPIVKIEKSVLMILRLGAYQILYMDKVPDSAACNESVELSKRYTHKGTAGFINGVLRHIAREKDAISYPDPDTVEGDSVRYGCPSFLVSLFRTQYGLEKSRAILSGMNRLPTVTLRVNTLRISADDLLSRLHKAGIPAEKTKLSPFGIRLDTYCPVYDLPGFEEGLFFVQDESSQLCALSLGAQKGETVLDICACPGGKSFSIAMMMENRGKLMSFDLHESKLSLVREGALRLGIDMLSTAVRNGAVFCEDLSEIADRVLCDVPCSGFGVIGKKPDLRHKKSGAQERLPEIQYAILQNSCRYVKPGGVLLYSTCTLNRAENEEVVERFLFEHPSFVPWQAGMPGDTYRQTFFPDEDDTDGFFIAKFRRMAQ